MRIASEKRYDVEKARSYQGWVRGKHAEERAAALRPASPAGTGVGARLLPALPVSRARRPPMLGIGLAKGEPGLFWRVMAAWPERVTNPAGGPAAFAGRLAGRVATGEVVRHPGILVPYALVVLLLYYSSKFVRWIFVS